MLSIRPLTAADLPLVLRLKTEAGWNQTPADLQRFLDLQGDGSFVAEHDGEPVGTVATFEFGAVGWIAMMLVAAAQRGRGIGRALMSRSLEHLEGRRITSIRLDATPLGRPLYEKLGFVAQFELARYAGAAMAVSCGDSTSKINLLAGQAAQHEAIYRLDEAATHTSRRRLIARLIDEQPHELRVAVRDGQVAGYITSRPGANARQIGPCIGDAAAGPMLLADALSRHAGEAVFVDVAVENTAAVQLAAAAGLSPQRTLTRMCRGQDAREDVSRFWASSSPEKG